MRIARRVLVVALLGAFAAGLVLWRADVRDYENLLLSDSAVVEVGRLTDVVVTSTGRSSTTRTSAVAGGTVYEQTGLCAWAAHEGEEVRIITHPDTDLWLMTTMDGTLSTERSARDRALSISAVSAFLLVVALVATVGTRLGARQRARDDVRTAAIARQHPGVRSRSEMRRLGILPGIADRPGLRSRGE